jgi:DNA polymerase-3 subunit gamma/tau
MPDEYRSLYRKYRPQSPDEVIGQEHVVRALVGAIREDRLSHAFLFCGPRGTGKTSTARILAKMVNCEQGPTAEPCGVCEQCIRIREGSHLDVVEIDAASHGGVDDARELRERAPTAPAMGREKVYIIDEAQRLSREAFDALLKVFEEPPSGVRFVLATTEPHKMPPTIVGRCQRFDFRRLSTEDLAAHLLSVAEREGVSVDPEAAEAMARQAEGSARDALSLLDQAMVLAEGTVTAETVGALIGETRDESRFELADAIAVGDARGVFETVNRLVQEGNDLRHLTGQVMGHFRDLLLIRSAPERPEVLDVPSERHARLTGQAGKFTPVELSRILSLLVAAQTDMRWTTSPRLTLELALVRAAIPEADPNPAGLAARIERLERLAGIEGAGAPVVATDGGTNGSSAPDGEGSARPSRPARRSSAGKGAGASASSQAVTAADPSPSGDPNEVAESPASASTTEPAERAEPGEPAAAAAPHAPSAGALDVHQFRRSWPQLLDRLQERRQMILRASLESVTPASYDGEVLELAFPPGWKSALERVRSKEEDLRGAVSDVFGVSPRIRCVAREQVGVVAVVEEEPPPSKEDAVAAIRAALGAEVEEVEG